MARTSSPSSSSAFLLGQDTDCATRREHKRGWGFVYGAPKSGFHRIAEFIHVEHAKDGVLSFNVEPGHTVTEATVAMFGPHSAAAFNRHASRPEATGDVVAWLASHPGRGVFRQHDHRAGILQEPRHPLSLTLPPPAFNQQGTSHV